ncbi:hypothetical protein AAHH87_00445 [Candidatus Hodgkinia cicadicola]
MAPVQGLVLAIRNDALVAISNYTGFSLRLAGDGAALSEACFGEAMAQFYKNKIGRSLLLASGLKLVAKHIGPAKRCVALNTRLKRVHVSAKRSHVVQRIRKALPKQGCGSWSDGASEAGARWRQHVCNPS